MDKISNNIKIIDLKKDESFIPQYIELRDSYLDLLLTDPVTYDGTKVWLAEEDAEVRCLVDNNVLLGAAVLYLNKEGEIAFFAKYQERGIGTNLLKAIENVARERKLDKVWAWVLSSNIPAQKVFSKNGYLIERELEKKFKNKIFKGIVFIKKLI